jgi:hypothetical protein
MVMYFKVIINNKVIAWIILAISKGISLNYDVIIKGIAL